MSKKTGKENVLGEKSTNKLRPDAPAFIPIENLFRHLLITQPKEAQCSRYSRKSVHMEVLPRSNSRSSSHISTNKNPAPRPILGRRENLQPCPSPVCNKQSPVSCRDDFGAREYRSGLRRSGGRQKNARVAEEVKKQEKRGYYSNPRQRKNK